ARPILTTGEIPSDRRREQVVATPRSGARWRATTIRPMRPGIALGIALCAIVSACARVENHGRGPCIDYAPLLVSDQAQPRGITPDKGCGFCSCGPKEEPPHKWGSRSPID